MTSEKKLIAAVSMDLKRIALAAHNGSISVTTTFCQEMLDKLKLIKTESCKPYLRKIVEILPSVLKEKDKRKLAEDALMYSTVLQNYVLYNW